MTTELAKIRRELRWLNRRDAVTRPFRILWMCRIRRRHRRKFGSNFVCIRCGRPT